MSKVAPVRCPVCHKILCDAAEGNDARLRFRCRHCRLRVVVVLTAAGATIVAAA